MITADHDFTYLGHTIFEVNAAHIMNMEWPLDSDWRWRRIYEKSSRWMYQ